ncbi:MAG: hypothetical protein NC489_31730 [Ruminococcus flavefaciens]|nr:hypothetical protein [Ruminococcus flavefaciens]
MASVERSLGMSNGALAKPIKNHTAIGSDKLQNILSFCPDLSLPWLFFGRGNMIIGEGTSSPANEKIISLQAQNELLQTQLNTAQNRIEEQAKELGKCETQAETIDQLRADLEKAQDTIKALATAKNATTHSHAPTAAPVVP